MQLQCAVTDDVTMSDDDDSAVVMISSRRTAPGNLFNLSSTTVWYDEVSAYDESDRSDVMSLG